MKHLPIYNSEYRTLLEDFERHLERVGYKEGSRTALPSYVREFFHWAGQRGINSLNQLTPGLIREHYDYLRQRPNRTNPGDLGSSIVTSHIYGLKTFMKYQQENGRITTNPFGVLKFPKPEYPPRQILTTKEIKVLYQTCETLRDKAILGIFYGCGLRRTEAEKLNINDINFKTQLLYVREGKGSKRRVVPMTGQVAADLKNYYLYERDQDTTRRTINKDNSTAFILNKYGGRMLGYRYWQRVKELIIQAGLPKQISLHHLRHSIATHLLESGLGMEQVRDFLGHRYLESTQVYTRISKQYLAEQMI